MIDDEKHVYEVVCCNNPEHVFSLISDIPLDIEDRTRSEETYCGYCDRFVHVTVRRELRPDEKALRRSARP